MYTPSAESLAVFDQLKAEVDHRRSAALASLRPTKTVCKESGEETGNGDGKCISGTSASISFDPLSPGQPTALPSEETVGSRKEKGTVEDTLLVNECEHPESNESSGIVSNPCFKLLFACEVRESDGQTFASMDPLSLSSSIKSWRVTSSSTSRQSLAVVQELQVCEKDSSASASSCTIGGVNETAAAQDCSFTSVSVGACASANSASSLRTFTRLST
ncbi:hypothetical protein FGB62_137g210 [Gracilaria domingensis]|nr:hypothetical protein FGB62_137g210 [Gracilaria domingensis]